MCPWNVLPSVKHLHSVFRRIFFFQGIRGLVFMVFFFLAGCLWQGYIVCLFFSTSFSFDVEFDIEMKQKWNSRYHKTSPPCCVTHLGTTKHLNIILNWALFVGQVWQPCLRLANSCSPANLQLLAAPQCLASAEPYGVVLRLDNGHCPCHHLHTGPPQSCHSGLLCGDGAAGCLRLVGADTTLTSCYYGLYCVI